MMSEWLREVSYILGIIGNFVLFMILFTPKIERKKANIILAVGFSTMLVVHQILTKGFHVSMTSASLFAMSIPSFILCYLLSEYKDGRFIFTFCLADITYVIVRIISAVLLSFAGNALMQSVVEFAIKIGMLGTAIFVAWKLRYAYQRMLKTMERGWGLLAVESTISYFFFYLLVGYSEKINSRSASLTVLLSYSAIVLVTYLVIFKLVMQISKTQAEEAKNQLLETQLKLQESELMVKQLYREMAYKDQLTGIGNRAAFEEKLADCGTAHKSVALFLFDINGLKQVNDNFGHAEGDYLIKNVASILGKTFEPEGAVYRVGGDEFVVIVEPNMNFDWQRKKEMVMTALEEAKKTAFLHKSYHGSVSAGCSIIEKADMEKIQQGLIFADQMMYEEKKHMKKSKKLI